MASIAVIVLVVATLTGGASARWRPLIALGGISYPLYLIHQNVGYVILRQLHEWDVHQVVAVGSTLVIILLLATILTHVFDVPVRRLLRARLVGPT